MFRKVFVIGINEAYDTAFLTFDVSMQTWTSTIISNMDFNIGNSVWFFNPKKTEGVTLGVD